MTDISILKRLVILSMLGIATLTLQGQSTFFKTYQSKDHLFIRDFSVTEDGSVIAVGHHRYLGVDWDVFLMKIDETGDVIWSKSVGDVEDEKAQSIHKTLDGNYIISGESYYLPNPATRVDLFVMKINSEGDNLWTKYYGGTSQELDNHCIITTSDSGFVFSGTTRSFGPGYKDHYEIKIDSEGDTVWTSILGGQGLNQSYQLLELEDSSLISVGGTECIGEGFYDGLIVKLSSQGDTLWTRSYGHQGFYVEWFEGITQTEDDGFLLAGQTTNALGATEALLVKVDNTGNFIWGKVYRDFSASSFKKIVAGTDGNYLVLGIGNGSNPDQICLYKIDPQGNILWIRVYGDSNEDAMESIKVLPNGKILLGGFNTNQVNAYGAMMKVDSIGALGCIEDSISLLTVDYPMIVHSGLESGHGTQVSTHSFTESTAPTADSIICNNGCGFEIVIEHSDLLCYNSDDGSTEVVVSGYTSPYVFLWNTLDTLPVLEGLSSGMYLLTVSDSASCSLVDSVWISQPDSLIILSDIVAFSASNFGQISIQVYGGTPPYDFIWSNGLTTDSISGLVPGLYEVTVGDSNGCSIEAAFEIEDLSAIEEPGTHTFECDIYPNPAKDMINIRFEKSYHSIRIRIYSMDGKLSRELTSYSTRLLSMDCHDLVQGVYRYEIYTNDQMQSLGKILIQ